MTGIEALKWAAKVAGKVSVEMGKTGLKHPEDSQSRDRCFARARTANYIKDTILEKIEEL